MKKNKITYKQIDLYNSLEKKIDKNCMKIKTEYTVCDDSKDGLGDWIFPNITSSFIDDALDRINIEFDQEILKLDTKDYAHIDLDESHLLFLLKFLRYSKKIDKKCDNMSNKEIDLYKNNN